MPNRRIRLRGITSLLLAPSLMIVAVSGLILYIGPRGRVADWTGWTFFGLTKDAWEELHIVVSLLLIPIAIAHWVLNWSVFWSYIKKKTGGLHLWIEMTIAGVLLAVVVAGTLLYVPPFSSTLQLSKYFQACWEQHLTGPPVAYAERFTLEAFAEAIDLDVDEMVAALEQEGLAVTDRTTTVEQFARRHGVTPPEVLAAIQKRYPQAGKGESEFD